MVKRRKDRKRKGNQNQQDPDSRDARQEGKVVLSVDLLEAIGLQVEALLEGLAGKPFELFGCEGQVNDVEVHLVSRDWPRLGARFELATVMRFQCDGSTQACVPQVCYGGHHYFEFPVTIKVQGSGFEAFWGLLAPEGVARRAQALMPREADANENALKLLAFSGAVVLLFFQAIRHESVPYRQDTEPPKITVQHIELSESGFQLDVELVLPDSSEVQKALFEVQYNAELVVALAKPVEAALAEWVRDQLKR